MEKKTINKQASFKFLAAAVLVIAVSSAGTAAAQNTKVGTGALAQPSFTDLGDSAFAFNALHSNTTGEGNTASGFEALYFNTTGGANTALGWKTFNR